MNIQELLKTDAKVNLTVSAVDLKEFALSLIEEARKMGEDTTKEREPVYTAQEAAKLLGVNVSSLWRWAKSGYLVPHSHIGRRRIYSDSQIEAIKKDKGF